MEKFSIPDSLRDLADPYPAPEVVLETAGGGREARTALVRLWISEGIPYAFRKCPAIYESVRSWLSATLGVHAKEIGLVGSARIGASLNPRKFGKSFSCNSDLDLFIVSEVLFGKLTEEFHRWSLAFESGTITANNPTEEKCWRNNQKIVPRNIEDGFINSRFIPNREPYPTTRRIEQCMFLLPDKLKRTHNAPKPYKADVRCYKSWDRFVMQNSLNLRDNLEKWKGAQS